MIKVNLDTLRKKRVRITQLDGKLPNLALMKLSHWHKSKGDEVYFTQSAKKTLFEKDYDIVYGSSIFNFSKKKQEVFLRYFPNAIIGGTGTENKIKVEDIVDLNSYEYFDYDLYPDYKNSIGFSQRGCRLACKFCVVPKKEGKNKGNSAIHDIWRGEPYPKNIVLLDNDFFGQPNWQEKAKEMIEGKFKINFSQGINIRLIDEESCEMLPHINYKDTKFKTKRLYTAWDNLGDEKIFMKGVERLTKYGVPTSHLLVYMIIGFKKGETWEDIYYRFNKIHEIGAFAYPMVFDNSNKLHKKFQKWAIQRYYKFWSWEDFRDKSLSIMRTKHYAKKSGQLDLLSKIGNT
tara:strand:- start:819 stop:1856 length:1038 start_codon:yes stop_codon:yes gene_type:complete